MTRTEYAKAARAAIERYDILEDELPRAICSVKGCQRHDVREFAGAFRTLHICARHLPDYRRHQQILRRIRLL